VTGAVDHAEGRVARAGQLGGSLHDPLEEGVERKLRAEGDPGLHEDPKPVARQGAFHARVNVTVLL
jgi:hypothetical protein